MKTYNTEEVAEMYKCSTFWVRKLIKDEKKVKGSGKFPNAFKTQKSNKWLIPESDIDSNLLQMKKE